MKELKTFLKEKGVLKGDSIVIVDTFLNQNVSIFLMEKIAEEFYEYFKEKKVDKIVTVETGGIAPSILLAKKFGVDLLILKKEKSLISEDVHSTTVKSFTKNKTYTLNCNTKNLKKGENVIFIDDFLANGECIKGVCEIAKNAEANIVGAGIIIEKSYQKGRDKIKDFGLDVYSLAKISELKDGQIIYED